MVATSTTTFNEPYTLARQFRLARPDQRRARRLESRNVQQRGDALNYSRRGALSHSDRYERRSSSPTS